MNRCRKHPPATQNQNVHHQKYQFHQRQLQTIQPIKLYPTKTLQLPKSHTSILTQKSKLYNHQQKRDKENFIYNKKQKRICLKLNETSLIISLNILDSNKLISVLVPHKPCHPKILRPNITHQLIPIPHKQHPLCLHATIQ